MILKNNLSSERFLPSSKNQILDMFLDFSGNKKIILEENSDIDYVLIVDDASIDIDFDLVGF
jgi:hypothetical protein